MGTVHEETQQTILVLYFYRNNYDIVQLKPFSSLESFFENIKIHAVYMTCRSTVRIKLCPDIKYCNRFFFVQQSYSNYNN